MKTMMNAEMAMDNNMMVSETECFQDEEILQLKAQLDCLESFNEGEGDYEDDDQDRILLISPLRIIPSAVIP